MKFKFEDLRVYQSAFEFSTDIYELTEVFPKAESFGLTSQLRRAAVSIALNIAEGHGDSDKQLNKFLNIAQGSVRECVVCLSLAKTQGYITESKEKECRKKLVEIGKMITSFKNKLNLS